MTASAEAMAWEVPMATASAPLPVPFPNVAPPGQDRPRARRVHAVLAPDLSELGFNLYLLVVTPLDNVPGWLAFSR